MPGDYYEINSNGITYRVLGEWDQTQKGNPFPSRINVLKSDRTLSDELVDETAEALVGMVQDTPDGSPLVPVPRSTPGKRPSMLPVIERLAQKTNRSILQGLKRMEEPEESSVIKNRDRPAVDEHARTLEVPNGLESDLDGHVVLIDDVLSTGRTAKGCVRALGQAGVNAGVTTLALQAGDGSAALVDSVEPGETVELSSTRTIDDPSL